MGKRNNRKSRPNYQLIPDLGTRHVIDQAIKGHEGNIKRHRFQQKVGNAKTHYEARRDAGNCVELRLTKLPRFESIDGLVTEVNEALEKVVEMLDGVQPSGTKYVQRCKLIMNGTTALVLVNDEKVAEKAIDHKTLSLFGESVMVVRSKVTLAGLGAQISTRQEPGSRNFAIEYAEFGEMEGKRFNQLWTSKDVTTDIRQQAQIQMVSKVLGLELGVATVRKGNAEDGTFEEDVASIRIEIPFHAIITAATYQRNSRNSDSHAVYLRLQHPPLLFRGIPVRRPAMAWARGEGEIKESRYVRTVDFTEKRIFSCVRAVRVFLDTRDKSFSEFVSELCRCHIGGYGPPKNPRAVPAFQEVSELRINDIMDSALDLNVPFAVRYEVECLHAIGAVSLTDLSNIHFWKRLAALSKVDALRVVDRMFTMACGQQDYRINAMKSLSKAIRSIASPVVDAVSNGGDNDESTAKTVSSNHHSSQAYSLTAKVSVVPTEAAHLIDPAVTRGMQAILQDAANETNKDFKFMPVRRVLVTPTRFLPCRAELDMLNRVLREYMHLRERFIRISFADEDGESISFLDSDDLYAQVRHWLGEGISVAGERFVFLAFSSSQLREHGCWFYNETRRSSDPVHIPTASDIRQGFGNLSGVRVPSKYAARMGQAFSSTVSTLTLSENEFKMSEDIFDAERKYTFSDGVGAMSHRFAKRVKEKLGLHMHDSPSAYQIRFAGAKGVLTVWRFSPSQIVLRPSMCKFESKHRDIEVVAVAKRLPFNLNRQIITLLEGLGVDADVFLKFQRKYLRDLDECMNPETGRKKSLDLLYKTGWGPGSSLKNRLRDSGPMANVVQLFQGGLTCYNCEFLYEVMLAFRKRVLKSVRNKARIPIRNAACGIGVLDEVGVLKADEIFAQFTDPETGVVRPVLGRVIVGRSPSLHPGDLQVVSAVKHQSLKDLVDVVVFPQVGERPLPSMLSGGDLDGDIFCVIWDRRLITADATKSALNYESVKEKPLDREVTIDDVKDFVIRYMRNDNLGRIAMAHLAHADREEEGIYSIKAKQLAILHSTAVDFAKTGVPAKFPLGLVLNTREEGQWPDFLGKHKKVSYKSKKALGLMYRECTRGKNYVEHTRFDQKGTAQVDRVFEQFSYDSKLDEEAMDLCEMWNTQVRTLMGQFGVETEAEIVSGQVTHFAMYNVVAKGKKKYFEQLLVLNRYMRELKSVFRAQFFSGVAKDASSDKLNIGAVHKMAAWYKAAKKVANEQRKRKGINEPRPMLSFPFVVSDVLVQIVASHLNTVGSPINSPTSSPRRSKQVVARG